VARKQQVAGNNKAHEPGNGQIRVRELDGLELIEEQRIAGHAGLDVAGHDEEQVKEEECAAANVAALQV